MPFVGRDADGEIVAPWDIDEHSDVDVECLGCGEALTVVAEHIRKNRSLVDEHFRHLPDGVRGCSGGVGGGGESALHKRRKGWALRAAMREFDCEAAGCERLIGDRRADARVDFSEPDPEFGRGLAIEYQHKNEDKNIRAVTRQYQRHGFTTIWLRDEHVTPSSKEVALFEGEMHTPWPECVPPYIEWGGDASSERDVLAEQLDGTGDVGASHELRERAAEVRLPPQFVDEQAQYLWRSHEWQSLFDPSAVGEFIVQGLLASGSAESGAEVRLPPEIVDEQAQRMWRNREWGSLFDPSPVGWFVVRGRVNSSPSQPPSAYIHHQWEPTISAEEWRTRAWHHRFRPSKVGQYLGDVRSSASVPFDWPGGWVPASAVAEGVSRGREQYERALSDPGADIQERPPNPFDDVQCIGCGAYWNIDKGHTSCPRCGVSVHWEWNMKTGRVDRGSVDDVLGGVADGD